jgi:hypothetical protein
MAPAVFINVCPYQSSRMEAQCGKRCKNSYCYEHAKRLILQEKNNIEITEPLKPRVKKTIKVADPTPVPDLSALSLEEVSAAPRKTRKPRKTTVVVAPARVEPNYELPVAADADEDSDDALIDELREELDGEY